MAAVVHVEEGLSVTRRAAVVRGIDRVAMIDEVLDRRRIADTALSAGTAMDPDQRRHRVVGAGLMRPVEDARDFQPVETLEAHDLGVHHLVLGDCGVERIGQLGVVLGCK